MRLLAVILWTAACVHAAEVQIRFAALERMLAAQIFTDEGRRYVRGSRTEKCNYAWLEQPKVTGSNGRLLIHARFTGKSSVDLFGRCIGMGDSFDLSISALPIYEAGMIGMRDVKAAPEGKAGFYASRVCSILPASLQREFRYPLAAEAKRGLEDPGAQPQYPRELRRFDVRAIRVTDDALILDVDFAVVVK